MTIGRAAKWMAWVGMVLVVLMVALGVYGFYLARQIEERFSGRRWQIPSTVYSDTTLLYPGQILNLKSLAQKLHQLGYQNVVQRPSRRGELRMSAQGIEIFLNDLHTPTQSRRGFPVFIQLDQGRIKSIHRRDSTDPLPILEIEPEELAQFFGSKHERRQLVSIQQVPQHFVFSVLAAEDNRFFEHYGFDPRGMIRAAYINIRYGRIRQGGSTITQQLAKNYFLTPERTISRKLQELIMSVVIELMYAKKEILEIYLNEIYLGQKGAAAINGVGEAAMFYFGKKVDELNLAEAASLAGMIKAPNLFSPFIDPERCRQRRDTVLQNAYEKGWVTDSELQKASQSSIQTVGLSAQRKKAPYFIDYLAKQLRSLYSLEALSSLGLSIYTTLDTEVQAAAEWALERGLQRLETSNPNLRRGDVARKLQGAVVVMQPKTGYILAMVGGRDYGASQFNRITQSLRQPGSAFKPFVYLAGLDRFTPSSRLSNEAVSYEVNDTLWEPRNFSPEAPPEVSLRSALTYSHNLATVDLAMQTGLDHVVGEARRFQFSTPIKPYPSLALGAFEVIPLELALGYCAFAADGIRPYPLSLKDVVDESGTLLKQNHVNAHRLIPPSKAFMMTSLLKSVAEEGTAQSLRHWHLASEIAGKTGTTNDFRDAWFVGYTPDILALVWVGFDDGESLNATGAAAALPIWADLMRAIPQYRSEREFSFPAGIAQALVCSESGLLAEGHTCPEPMTEIFLENHVPTDSCPLHPKKDIFKRIFKQFKKWMPNG